MPALAFAVFTAEPMGGLWSEYLKTVSVLIGICLLAMAAAKVLAPRLRSNLPRAGRIRVLATQPLEPRKTLYIVKAGETAVLLATSGNAVHFLTKLEGDAGLEVEQASQPSRVATPAGITAFAGILKERYLRRHP